MQAWIATLLTWVHRIISLLPDAISSRIYGTLFGLRLGLGLPVSGAIYEREVKITKDATPATVYATHTEPPKNMRTMVVIHGLSCTAHKDPRIVNLAQALAAASPGNLVVVPYVRQLAVVDLADDPISAIRTSIEAVISDNDLCPSGQVSVVSACISAGFCIVAAADMRESYGSGKVPIDSMFLVGPHADVRNVLQHAKDRKGVGDCRYGLYAVMSSFIQPVGNPLSKMLAAYCIDDHLTNLGKKSNTVGPLLEEFPEEAKEYKRLLDDGEYTCAKAQETFDFNKETFDSMSGVHKLNEVSLQYVTLVHSKVDDIVPPSESLVLKKGWEGNAKMKVSCMITSLLNHGDQEQLNIGHIPEILRMLDCFSTFFRRVDQILPQFDTASEMTMSKED